MKKKSSTFGILGIVVLVLTLSIFLTMLAPALTSNANENFAIYDLVFGNSANHVDATPAYVAMFILPIISAVFILLALFFSWGQGHKFAGFLHFVSGLLLLVTGVLFFLGLFVAPDFLPGASLSMGYGLYLSGAFAIVGALLALYLGIKGLREKNN